MKTLTLILLFASINSFSQNSTNKKIYSVGFGIGNENNISNYGIYITNDLKIYTKEKSGLTARISFFQSTGSIEKEEHYGYRNHSGGFLDFGYFYSFVNGENFKISINLGPSLEIGSETYLNSTSFYNGVLTENYANNKLFKIGLFSDLEFSFRPKRRLIHTLGLKSNMYGIYPEFLGIVYKIGFEM